MSKRKHRTVTMEIHNAEVSTSWGNASIAFLHYQNAELQTKVVLKILRPSDISFIRDQLNIIAAQWKREVDALEVGP